MSHVQCPNCQKTIQLTNDLYGVTVRCSCNTVLQMPNRPSTEPEKPTPAFHQVPDLPSTDSIEFHCPACQKRLSAKPEYSGQISQCECGVQFTIPNRSGASQQPSAAPTGMPTTDPTAANGVQPYQQAPSQPRPAFVRQGKKRKGSKRKIVRVTNEEENPEPVGEGVSWEIVGGVLLMLFSVVLFIGFLTIGYFVPYTLILFCLGLGAIIKALAT